MIAFFEQALYFALATFATALLVSTTFTCTRRATAGHMRPAPAADAIAAVVATPLIGLLLTISSAQQLAHVALAALLLTAMVFSITRLAIPDPLTRTATVGVAVAGGSGYAVALLGFASLAA